MTLLLSGQGQFNFVHVIITPLDYECNLLTLQCRKGEAWARWVGGQWVGPEPRVSLCLPRYGGPCGYQCGQDRV
jgi:hypothetical protein